MTSSRAALKKPITRSGSRETAFSVENPYKPGFLDPSTPESFKMSVDSELSAISNAFYQSAEVTSNLPSDEDISDIQDDIDTIYGDLTVLAQEITRVEAETEAGFASIQEELVILGDTDTLLAQQITDLQVSTDAGFAEIHQELTALSDQDTVFAQALTELEASTEAGFASVSDELTVLADADTAMAQRITNLEVETDQGFASIEEDMSVISDDIAGLEAKWSITADVNGKISGIELTNDGVYSEFIVMADRFAVTDGTNNSEPPFEVVNGSTRIKSAYVNTIQSDNWDGGSNGWFISNAGDANFNNVTVRGTINADSSFKGVGASGNRISQNGISFSTGATEFATLTVSEPLQEEAILIIQGFLNLDNGTDLKVGLRRNGNIVADCPLFGVRDGAPVSWLLTEDLPKGFSGTLGIETFQVNGSWSSSSFSPGFWFLVRKV